ncbi:Smr/MutS family protein [Polynucleobacter sp. IMCC 29146]|uniref:Smr/MutS family protein n=1 Tax=Polynucleobacter sp. IMCC 29146 TaxID=2780953 RepID=UPI001F2C1A78|nr:Smr/MutS family protein [Polynucleobacter sp. IMCC 29146]MCE7530724.1 Smr/MutS family protein [Polynucleobacter sp. IMCC 29146]
MSKPRTYLCRCPQCGGERQVMGVCRLCGSADVPEAITETLIFDLELGAPLVEEAIAKFEQYLGVASNAGFKTMLVIHGYGSSGKGGEIRKILRDNLEHNFYSDRIVDYYPGEDLKEGNESYTQLLKRRPSLQKQKKQFKNSNAGELLSI